jgi:serine/threonine protein kinase
MTEDIEEHIRQRDFA